MMLEHLGAKDAAADIQNAVIRTLASKKVQTADMGGRHKTFEMGDAITKTFLAQK
jgi:isocitrate/isopropylmalate dehydrogenase